MAISKTRVCVKNLPPTATEHDLREFFQHSGTTTKTTTTTTTTPKIEITDCKVLKNSKGKSRKVAFLGFRKEEQAAYIVSHFHRTFMGMTRLSVEPAMAKKEEDAKATTSEAEKAAADAKTSLSSLATKSTKQDESRHKREIRELFGDSGQKSKFWANDEGPMMQPDQEEHEEDLRNSVKSTHEETSEIDSDSSNSSDDSDDVSHSEEDDDGKNVPTPPPPKSVGLSDLDFLRSKQKATDDLEAEDYENDTSVRVEPAEDGRENDIATDSEAEDDSDDDSSSSSSSSSDSSSSEEKDDKATSGKAPVTSAPPGLREREDPSSLHAEKKMEEDNDVDSTNEEEGAKKEETSKSRLFVRNLPFETTEEELGEYFSAYGNLIECHIPVDDQKRNKGFAFIQYASAVDALAAQKQLDKVDFQGRLLHILPAKPAPKQVTATDENLTWKQRQELARKEQEVKNGEKTGWSSSFVRGDAVVDNLAERLGLRKSDFLAVKDKLSSGDAAVRLALGETQIIEENREYFRQNGVDMDALVSDHGKEAQRSNTSILVKNLPFDTHVDELAKLFQMDDASVKILLPPSRTIALVQYGHHSDAKKAFKRLAYRRFKHVPIYLEWAPLAAKTEDGNNTVESNSTSAPNVQNTVMADSVDDIDGDLVDGTNSTIYVKNLNFASTEETLRQVFEKNVGSVRSVRIPKKVVPARNGEEPQLLSMGYGFVELESEAAVKKALQVLQGKLVEGHAWEVTVSSNNNSNTNNTGKSKLTPTSKNPTKLMVRNVPFQASRSEILKLFGSFGQLRRVRLPKKFDGSHRGFAFVEFLTSKEAVAAMNALSRTHLYGRHLVLEWATDDDEDLDRLRDKAQRDTVAALPKNKRMKFT